jgi:hypothetical protein
MANQDQIQKIIYRYFELWSTQNPEGLSEIFADDSKYIVHPFGIEEYTGIDAIRGYWNAKPVSQQLNPKPRVISQLIGENIAFVEWETTFKKLSGGNKKVRGILLLEIEGNLIKELREHYDSIDEK